MMLCASFIIFLLVNLSPTDPATLMLSADATQEQIEALHEELGFNKPLLVQYFNYLFNALRGDFGNCYYSNTPVLELIAARLPNTLILSLSSVALSLVIGLPLGMICSIKQYSITDSVLSTVAIFAAAMPPFLLAMLLMLAFSLKLGLFPASGITMGWKSWVLPIVTIAVGQACQYLRYSRSNMLDSIREDYVRTARSKGAPEPVVIVRHALRNALLPIVTITGVFIGNLMSNAVVIETVFSIPGIGLLVVESIKKKNVPVVLGCIIVLAGIIMLINLIVDILYAYIDPRIKARYLNVKKKKPVKVEGAEKTGGEQQ